jgi:hypothetical protein
MARPAVLQRVKALASRVLDALRDAIAPQPEPVPVPVPVRVRNR